MIKDLRTDVISNSNQISKLKYKIGQLKQRLEDAVGKLNAQIAYKEEHIKEAKKKPIRLSTVIFSSIVDSATQNSGLGLLEKRLFMMNRQVDSSRVSKNSSPTKPNVGKAANNLSPQKEKKPLRLSNQPTVFVLSPRNIDNKMDTKIQNPFQARSPDMDDANSSTPNMEG